MPERRRFATRDELNELLWERAPVARVDVTEVLDALSELGVDLAALVQITVDEPAPQVEFRAP